MEELIFCPCCLLQKKLTIIGRKKGIHGVKYVICDTCKNVYPAGATLASEDVVRSMIKNSNGQYDYLLQDLEEQIGKE